MAHTENSRLIEPLNELNAITPLDGRYRSRIKDLIPYSSEDALIRTRVEIEARYLIALSEEELVRSLSSQEIGALKNIGSNLTSSQVRRVKEIEEETKHDVKAMERAFREFVKGTSLEDTTEMIHFALTSEDVNNLAYRLLLLRGTRRVSVPAVDKVVDSLADLADKNKNVPMLARTHGQPAVPTTLGKEMANIAVRLNGQARQLEEIPLTGKLDGAVGNFNAHAFAAPEVDWIWFSKRFVQGLGLQPNLFTTQINPYEDVIKMFQTHQRVNGVVIDIDQDMWRYISDDWFSQEVKKDEVGSSTMPQKVNPLDFENSEGNALMANAVWEGMSRKLAVSRLQRDLSDSTVIRNIGLGLGFGLVSYKSTLGGLKRVYPNYPKIEEALNQNWAILTEGIQTVARRAGEADPYSLVKELARGQKIGSKEWREFIGKLPFADEVKERLLNLTPRTYIGNAEKLTKLALNEIKDSRPDHFIKYR